MDFFRDGYGLYIFSAFGLLWAVFLGLALIHWRRHARLLKRIQYVH